MAQSKYAEKVQARNKKAKRENWSASNATAHVANHANPRNARTTKIEKRLETRLADWSKGSTGKGVNWIGKSGKPAFRRPGSLSGA